MKNFEKLLDEYARLIVEFGANVQPGKPVLIRGSVDAAPFVRKLTKYAYERGADEVVVKWNDDYITKQNYEHASEEVLGTYENYKVMESEALYERGATLIAIHSEDPELLKEIDPERIKLSSKTRLNATKHLMKYTMNDIVSWIVVAVPSVSWAEKVYPKLEKEAAVDKLWDEIFKFVRVSEDGDALKAWEEHLDTMTKHAKTMNEKQFVGLKYKSANGTDLYVAMPKNHIWHAADAKNADGTRFIPNMPTEEVFTAPNKFGTHGRLISTMPLSHNGKLIKDIDLTFEDGKVVKYSASENEEALKDMLEMDEGAKHLGEVALVPYDSPISNAKTIFFNTLFDENASCHFALGKAYPTSVVGGAELADDELEGAGLNDSMIHVDFMVGSSDLSIIGVEEDGTEFTIFKNGNFAF